MVIHTPHTPVLCTGFEGSAVAAASHLFEFSSDTTNDTTGDEDGDDDDDDIDMVKGAIDDDNDTDDDSNDETSPSTNDDDDNNNNNKVQPSCTLGASLFTMDDESTKVLDVFLVGPTVCGAWVLFLLFCVHIPATLCHRGAWDL
mmetsp:Transcript_25236/g.25570  ORF Transcript_25236/g.25570 Transcript_25236/m.25570 type:complete len:144 (+) Transcript_25236:190-621(+)